MTNDAMQAAHSVADTLGERLSERKMDRLVDTRLRAIEKNLVQVDNRIEALGKRFPRIRGPRFPFGLVLLAGLGYALYNPKTRAQLLGLLGNVSPAARDAIEGVIGKSQDAVADVQGGRDPVETIKNAAQNVSQQARDGVQDIKNDLQKSGDRMGDRADSAVDQAADSAKDVANDAKRGVDRLADRAQDKANDLKH